MSASVHTVGWVGLAEAHGGGKEDDEMGKNSSGSQNIGRTHGEKSGELEFLEIFVSPSVEDILILLLSLQIGCVLRLYMS